MLTRNERALRRANRKEIEYILAKNRERGFPYVLKITEPPRIAFGTSLPRETLPLGGRSLTPFMRRHQGEKQDGPAPWHYKIVDYNFPTKINVGSKRGSSAFVSKAKRLYERGPQKGPCIGMYETEIQKPEKAATVPFGHTTKRPPFRPSPLPGPPTYPYQEQLPRYKESRAFGGKRIIWPAVAVICTPINISKCVKCGLTPYGDYFRNFTSRTDMCRPCMNKERNVLRNCTFDVFLRMRMSKELDLYNRVRHCSFYHDHGGTSAAVQIISDKTLKFKIRKENYLYQYMK